MIQPESGCSRLWADGGLQGQGRQAGLAGPWVPLGQAPGPYCNNYGASRGAWHGNRRFGCPGDDAWPADEGESRLCLLETGDPQRQGCLTQEASTRGLVSGRGRGQRKETQALMLSCGRLSATPWTMHGLPGSSVHGVLQARTAEWAAISTPGVRDG